MAENVQMTNYSSRKILPQDEDSKVLAIIQNNYFQKLLNQQSQAIANPQSQFYIQFLTKLGQCCIPCSIFCHCCCSYPLYQQKTGQLGLLTHFGKYREIVEPGLKVINPLTQSIFNVNLRTQAIIINQSVITKDNVQFKIQTVVFYRIFSPTDTVYKLSKDTNQIKQCVEQISKSSLRLVIGSMQLQKIIENREMVGHLLQIQINRHICIWGLTIDACNIKQLWLPGEMLDAFSSVAVAKRKSQASIISAKANVQSAKLLRQASQILDSKASMQIRYLETIQEILFKKGDNIIYLSTNPRNNEIL